MAAVYTDAKGTYNTANVNYTCLLNLKHVMYTHPNILYFERVERETYKYGIKTRNEPKKYLVAWISPSTICHSFK